jgi:hypothetical protein
MPAQPDLTRAAEADREAYRQFVIFLGSIFVAIGITVASFVIATSAAP